MIAETISRNLLARLSLPILSISRIFARTRALLVVPDRTAGAMALGLPSLAAASGLSSSRALSRDRISPRSVPMMEAMASNLPASSSVRSIRVELTRSRISWSLTSNPQSLVIVLVASRPGRLLEDLPRRDPDPAAAFRFAFCRSLGKRHTTFRSGRRHRPLLPLARVALRKSPAPSEIANLVARQKRQ